MTEDVNDWGDRVGRCMFDRPRARMLCSDSRTVRLLCLAVSLPWFMATVILVMTALGADVTCTLLKVPLKHITKAWAGPICEDDENA
jgi:hypothetical protein